MPGRDGKKKVLITGAAGDIGRMLREHLRDRYDLRLMVHSNRADFGPDEDVVAGDILDLDSMCRLVKGCDAVAHFAVIGDTTRDEPDRTLDNIAGSYNVVEACRINGVNKLVFASTNHVTGMYERDGLPCQPDLPVRPDGLYGAGKAGVEALYHYYSDQYGLSIISIRIGSCTPLGKPAHRRHLATWLSPADISQLVWRSVESDVRWLIVYGVSGNTRRYFSIESAQQVLGYAPSDNAEDYYEEIMQNELRRKTV